jgi:tetratricopeptide (TPR) repeat protein/serine/threonine protein kinase/WD40 repeat protein
MSERSIFLAAIDIADAAERAAYLDQACGDDAALRRHIEELLAAEGKLGGFLARPHVDVERTDEMASVVERPGAQIGPYKLLEQIGEGGFGVVFMAEQQQPVRRKVALKVLKAGMDTRQVIARFEAERQALALMDHPNIARVLDAGATANGRPYFVMELVRGIPITQFCDEAQLTTRERLELFVNVCQAAQHAHQKGIIHRDIKPTNVLVTLHDGTPVVKVIDFGVAKATGQQLTEKTLFTGFAQMIGTPLYMSPEQAALSGLDIDTRSDIYSLGVLLYELLTGTTPFDKKRLASAAFDEIRRIIREEEAVKPSTRISTLGATATSISALRKTEPRKLSQLLRNELDWIVMKALEKDRTHRYETASAFAADVGRYLSDEQVEAHPPSTLYRLKKFARRNRVAFTSGSLIAAALLIGLAVSTVLAVVASRQRDRAEIASRETDLARREAEAQRDQAEKARTEETRHRQLAEEREAEAKAARMAEVEQRQVAEQERLAAEEQRDKATSYNNQLQSLTQEQRRTLYAAEMNLVRLEAQRSNLAGMREILLRQLPGPNDEDLRGFEWNYWYRFLHQAKVLLRLDEVSNQVPPEAIAIVPGGDLVAVQRNRRTELIEVATGKLRHTAPASLRVGADRTSFDNAGRMVVTSAISESVFRRTYFPEGLGRAPSVQVFDPAAPLRKFDSPADTLTSLAYMQLSPDGRLVAAIGLDASHKASRPACRIVVWNFASGEVLHSLVENRELNRIRFSQDGERLAAFVCHSTVEREDKVRDVAAVFDTTTGERLGLVQHDDDVDQLAFLPDNQHLLCTTLGWSGRNRKEIFRWKIGEGSLVRLGAEYMPDHLAMAVSPDGKLAGIASHTIPNVRLIDTKTGIVVHNLHSEATNITSITFSPDGKQLLACGTMGVVLAWDLADHDDLFGIRAKPLPNYASRSAISADQSVLAYAKNADEIYVRRRDGTEVKLSPTNPGKARGTVRLLFSPNQHLLVSEISQFSYVSGTRRTSVTLHIYDVVQGKFLWGGELPAVTDQSVASAQLDRYLAPPALAFSPNSQHLAQVRAGRLQVWNARTGQVLPSPANESAVPLTVSGLVADAGTLLVADLVSPTAEQGQLRLLDAISGSPLAESSVTLETPVTQLVPSPNGRHVALVRGARHQVQILHVADGRKTVEGTGDYVVYSADGSQAALVETRIQPSRGTPSPTVERIDRATLWDIRSQKQLSTVTFVGNRAESLVFSPDGKRLLSLHGVRSMSGGAVPEGRLWDVLSGREMMTIPIADVNHYAWDMAFEPAGNKLISCLLVKPLGSGGDGQGAVILDGTPLSEREDASLVAHPLVAELLRNNPLAHEVIAELEASTKIRASVKGAAIALVRPRLDKPELAAEACLTALASEFGSAGQYERALKWAQGYVRRWPDDPVGSILIGVAQFRLGQSAESLVTLSSEQASRPCSHTPDASRIRHSFLALANLQAGNFQKAEEHYIAELQDRIVELRSSTGLTASRLYVSMSQLTMHPSIWLERFGKALHTRYDANTDGQITAEEYRSLSSVAGNFMTSFDRNGDGVISPPEYGWRYSQNIRSQMEPAQRLESIQTALARDPTDPSPWGQRGDLRRAAAEYDQAIADYTEAIRLAPSDALYYRERGYAWYQKREYDKAIEDLSESLLRNPKSADTLNVRGRAYDHTGQRELAKKDFDECLQLDPNFVNSLANRGQLAFTRGDYDAALKDFDEAIKLNPQYGYAFSKRGMLWQKKGEVDKALADLTEAIRLKAADYLVYAYRGTCWRTKREFDKALADFDDVLKLNPKYDWALATRGAVWTDKGSYDKSLEDYDAAIRLNPKVASYYNGRGVAWSRKGQADKALSDFDQAIQVDPKYARAYSNRALQLQRRREIDKAVSNFAKAIELSTGPDLLTFLKQRGDFFMNERAYELAVGDYTELIRLARDSSVGYTNRGLAWLRHWEFDKAAEDLDEAISRNPKDASAWTNRGALRVLLGQYDDALTDFDAVIRLSPKSTAAHCWRGLALEKLGQSDNAEAAFQTHQKLFPKPVEALHDRATRWTRYREYAKALTDWTALLALEPENPTYLNQRAFLLAVVPDEKLRNGKQALEDATKANDSSKYSNYEHLDTLAAAHAETGDFDEAVKWQEKAVAAAPELTRAQYTARLALYGDRKPYRELPKTELPKP